MMEVVITQNKQELDRLEGIIQENIGAFYEVGHALMEIRDKKYYREVLGFETFEAYCKAKWDFRSDYARRLIASAETVDNVKNAPMGAIPTSERQVRPLLKLKDTPDQQLIAWQKAVETAPDGKVTGAHVYKIVKGMTMATEKEKRVVLPQLATEARQLVNLAISQLGRIRDDDPRREKEFERVLMWINANRKGGKV